MPVLRHALIVVLLLLLLPLLLCLLLLLRCLGAVLPSVVMLWLLYGLVPLARALGPGAEVVGLIIMFRLPTLVPPALQQKE